MLEPLLQRVARGDESAVAECLTRYGGLVWTIALRWLGNDRSEAEDMTQEIFVDIWKSAARFNPSVSSETTFVTLIARRRLIDRRRRQARHSMPADLPNAVTCPRSLDPDRLEIEDEAARALRALDDIEPEQRRRILLMSIHQGLTHEQIAQTMRLPLGTVKTHARRGLLELRAKLQDANLSSHCKGVSR